MNEIKEWNRKKLDWLMDQSVDLKLETRRAGDSGLGLLEMWDNGRKKLLWDGENMKITNLEEANQFVGRKYREGWEI